MSVYKARTNFIHKEYNSTQDKGKRRLLGSGYISDDLLGDYQEYIDNNPDPSPETDFDKITNGNYFAIHPDRVAGKVVAGTGFLNPFIVKGKIEDVCEVVAAIIKAAPGEAAWTEKTAKIENAKRQARRQADSDKVEDFNTPEQPAPAPLKKYKVGDVVSLIDTSEEPTMKFFNKATVLSYEGDTLLELKAHQDNHHFLEHESNLKLATETPNEQPETVSEQEPASTTDFLKHGMAAGRIIISNSAPTFDKIKTDNSNKKPTMAKPKQDLSPKQKITPEELVLIGKRKNYNNASDDGKRTQNTEETIAKYNPGLSVEEIKAWVYHKRRFGNPMRGWEKYYLAGGGGSNMLIQTTKETVIKDNKFTDISTIPAGAMLGALTKFKHEYRDVNDLVVKTPTMGLVWVNKDDVKEVLNRTGESQAELDSLVAAKALIFDGFEYYPIPVFLFGDIYEKIKLLQQNHDLIVAKYGEEINAEQIARVREYMPKMKSFREPVASNRPYILCLSEFANDAEIFGITALKEDTGVRLGYTQYGSFNEQTEKLSLFEAFVHWMQEAVKDTDLKNTTRADIKKYYFAKSVKWPKDDAGNEELTNAEKDELVGNARLEAERLFSDFLANALTFEDAVALDAIWNQKYNAFTSVIQFVDKVPIGFEGSTHFKADVMEVTPAQRQGLAYLQLTGSGCLAYDVGFGKTLTCILNLAQLISQGAIKRPLIVVPKPTYKNWLKELFGYWTDGEKISLTESFPGATYHHGAFSGINVKMNDWYNLSGSHYQHLLAEAGGNINKLIPEGTITVVSFKGFEQMGFSNKVSTEMFDSIARVIMQKGVNDDVVTETKKGKKEKVSFYQKVQGWLGLGNKNAIIDVDVCGFDHLSVDEAHNFKNAFPSCGKDEETGRKLFDMQAGQSSRAVKMFFIANYIQRTFGKKVVELTATPFTNSPLEIYSMLSYIGLDTLNQYNLFNIKKFFEQFVLQTNEYVIDAKGEITTKPVIKAFQNLKLLQTILYNHFHYKDDPKEAGVVRPCLIELPNKDINTYLEMTEWQKRNQAEVKSMAKTVSRDNPGAVLKAINMSLDNAFSPYLFDKKVQVESAEQFVEDSPKIKYTMECIRTVKEWHESRNESCSGQVIYSNRGVDYFEYIKDYLIENIGFKRKLIYDDETISEVEIISGGGGEGAEDRKELIKDAFNAGVVKIIIGTGTIREGINLQKRGTCIYDLYPEWNPTDITQLIGRIHRQGNMYGYVRFVMPLIIGSMDNFINQKLDEKESRIQGIWKKIGDDSNVLENSSNLDPAEVKYALLDDPNEKFKILSDTKKAEVNRTIAILLENKAMIESVADSIEDLKTSEDSIFVSIKERKATFSNYLSYLNKIDLTELKDGDRKKTLTDIELVKKNLTELLDAISKYEGTRYDMELFLVICRMIKSRKFEVFTDFSDIGGRIKRNIGSIVNYSTFRIYESDYERLIESYSQVRKAEKSVLKAYGKSWLDDLTPIKHDIERKIEDATNQQEFINGDEYKQTLLRQIMMELEAARSLRGELSEQVARFASLNHVLSYLSDSTDKENCPIPTGPCCESTGVKTKHQDKTMERPVSVSAPELKARFKPNDFVKYEGGDQYKETWQGQIISVVPLDGEFAYRVNAYGKSLDGMLHDSEKTNERYEAVLSESTEQNFNAFKTKYEKERGKNNAEPVNTSAGDFSTPLPVAGDLVNFDGKQKKVFATGPDGIEIGEVDAKKPNFAMVWQSFYPLYAWGYTKVSRSKKAYYEKDGKSYQGSDALAKAMGIEGKGVEISKEIFAKAGGIVSEYTKPKTKPGRKPSASAAEPVSFNPGVNFGVPENYGREIKVTLTERGFEIIQDGKNALIVRKGGNDYYFNDNGGEFNFGENKPHSHIGNIAYSGTFGIKPAHLVAQELEEALTGEFKGGSEGDDNAEAIELLKMLVETQEGAEKEETLEAIELLEMLV